jgi:hypothetical protein
VTERPLLAVDAPSLYFRAFHGIPESAARTGAGEPVNAIRGFLDMIAQLIRTRGPDRLVCALGANWRPAWRVALVPSYKQHRVAHGDVEEVPASLEKQVPVLLEVLRAVGIPASARRQRATDVACHRLRRSQRVVHVSWRRRARCLPAWPRGWPKRMPAYRAVRRTGPATSACRDGTSASAAATAAGSEGHCQRASRQALRDHPRGSSRTAAGCPDAAALPARCGILARRRQLARQRSGQGAIR